MEVITIECPKCKGELFAKEETKKIFCMYCRNEVVIRKTREEIGEINHEFKAKLAIAKHAETLYMRNEKTFNEVMAAYDDVRLVGAHHAEYWLSRSRFFVKGVLKEFDLGKVELSEQSRIVELYTLWMDTATEYYQGLESEVESEKKKKIIEINAVFDRRKEELSAKRLAEEEELRLASEAREKQQQLAMEKHAANAPKRRKIAIIVSAIVVFGFIGVLIAQTMQDRAEEQRLIAEAEEARQYAEEARQYIESRLTEGYSHWSELVNWATDQEISWRISVSGEEINEEYMELISSYGVVGDYSNATTKLVLRDEIYEPVLILNFENATHNHLIAELYEINNNSEDGINNWLRNGGLESLEPIFNMVNVYDYDYSSAEQIPERPIFGKALLLNGALHTLFFPILKIHI